MGLRDEGLSAWEPGVARECVDMRCGESCGHASVSHADRTDACAEPVPARRPDVLEPRLRRLQRQSLSVGHHDAPCGPDESMARRVNDSGRTEVEAGPHRRAARVPREGTFRHRGRDRTAAALRAGSAVTRPLSLPCVGHSEKRRGLLASMQGEGAGHPRGG